MNIALTGFMASGKTTIGRRLAKRLDYKFVDTDEMIAEAAGMTINEIFKTYGEEYFRRLEAEIVKKASELEKSVISTGGGVVLNSENIDELRKNCLVVNLSPSFGIIKKRVERAAATRPLMNGRSIESIEKMFRDRQPFYDNCDYKLKITENMNQNDIVGLIIKYIKKD